MAQETQTTNVLNINTGRGHKCFSFPHGFYTVLPSLLTTMAWIMALSSHNYCDFVNTEYTLSNNPNADLNLFQSTGAGLWSWKGDGACFWYPADLKFDARFRTAQAFSILSVVFGGATMVFIWTSSCIPTPVFAWRCQSLNLFFACFCEGMTLMIFHSPTICGTSTFRNITYSSKCSLAWGANVSIATTCLWFLAAISLCKINPPELPPPVSIREVITTVETVAPDGTKTTTTKKEYVRDVV